MKLHSSMHSLQMNTLGNSMSGLPGRTPLLAISLRTRSSSLPQNQQKGVRGISATPSVYATDVRVTPGSASIRVLAGVLARDLT